MTDEISPFDWQNYIFEAFDISLLLQERQLIQEFSWLEKFDDHEYLNLLCESPSHHIILQEGDSTEIYMLKSTHVQPIQDISLEDSSFKSPIPIKQSTSLSTPLSSVKTCVQLSTKKMAALLNSMKRHDIFMKAANRNTFSYEKENVMQTNRCSQTELDSY